MEGKGGAEEEGERGGGGRGRAGEVVGRRHRST